MYLLLIQFDIDPSYSMSICQNCGKNRIDACKVLYALESAGWRRRSRVDTIWGTWKSGGRAKLSVEVVKKWIVIGGILMSTESKNVMDSRSFNLHVTRRFFEGPDE